MPARDRHTRTRVSSYQARIERTLTDFYEEIPETRQASQEWLLVAVGHTNGVAQCELCGHFPIRRLFWIRSQSEGRELMIGSECARNYARVDLVDAYMRRLQRHQTRARNDERNAERAREWQERNEAVQAQRRDAGAALIEANRDAIEWLSENHIPNEFLTSVWNYYQEHGYLSDRQIAAVRRNMDRAVSEAGASSASEGPQEVAEVLSNLDTPDDLPAEVDDCARIMNGAYTISEGRRRLAFQIYTVRSRRSGLYLKRLIKLQQGDGSFKAIAFLTRGGGYKLWRSQSFRAGTEVETLMSKLLTILRDDNIASGMASHSESGSFSYFDSEVNFALNCRCCNRVLRTAHSNGVGTECQTVDENYAANRVRSSRRTPTPQPAVEPVLVLSELGSGEIQ